MIIPTWTFARPQLASYQTYGHVKPTFRKPKVKSTIPESQKFDLSFLGYVYSQKNWFRKNMKTSSMANSHHTLGVKGCVSRDVFYMVLTVWCGIQDFFFEEPRLFQAGARIECISFEKHALNKYGMES